MTMSKQVAPLYMTFSEKLEHRAVVTKVGESEINKKPFRWVQLDETIFHPKGGGQPPDEGAIDGVMVAYVHKEVFDKSRLDQFEIFHCFDLGQEINFKEGDEVTLKVDSAKRKFYSRLHTAGHIVAEATSKHFPELEAYQGNHYPDNAYVKFRMKDREKSYDKEEIKQKISDELQLWVEQDLLISNAIQEMGMRSIKITQDWSACGGTHVNSLKEIGLVEIPDVSINKKEAVVTIKYKLGSL